MSELPYWAEPQIENVQTDNDDPVTLTDETLDDCELAGYTEDLLERTLSERTEIHYDQTYTGVEVSGMDVPSSEKIVRHTALALDRPTTEIEVGTVDVASRAMQAAGEREMEMVEAPAVDCGDYAVGVIGRQVIVQEQADGAGGSE
jgi:hypothetical protein